MQIIALGVRALQLIFCAIVLALSVVMIHQNAPDYHSSLISFAAFCGAWGLIVAVAGIAHAFVESIPGFIMAAVDGLTTLFFLASAIAFADKLKVHSCNADKNSFKPYGIKGPIGKFASWYTATNDITNGGYAFETDFNFVARCQEAQADTAFLFFALATFIASIALDFFGRSSGGGGGGGFRMPKIGRRKGGASFV